MEKLGEGKQHLRRTEFNFLQYTVPEVYESIGSEDSGKVTEYSKLGDLVMR